MTPKIVGAKYRCNRDGLFYSEGDIVTMVMDDNTDVPYFENQDNSIIAIDMKFIELIDQPNSDLYTKAEELWQTLNAVNILLGDSIPFEVRANIVKVLKTCNPSLNKTINNEEANS